MTVYGSVLPGAARIAAWAFRMERLTPEARRRLKVLAWHRAHGGTISLTARRFGLDRGTVRRWVSRLKAGGALGLKDRSRRPHHLRQPTTPWTTVEAVCRVRRVHPTWSKYKITAVLGWEDVRVSSSTVGRILKRRGLIDPRVSQRKRRAVQHPRKRFPRGLVIRAPGYLVQMDTKVKTLVGGKRLYQFTAIDVLTKRRVLEVSTRCSSHAAARFLLTCFREFPFPLRAVQTDNGPEFRGAFARLLAARGITHYFGDPHWPRCQSYVERSHRTDDEEFYAEGNLRSTVTAFRPLLKAWQETYNTARPHAALRYLTPAAYEARWRAGALPTRDVVVLQS